MFVLEEASGSSLLDSIISSASEERSSGHGGGFWFLFFGGEGTREKRASPLTFDKERIWSTHLLALFSLVLLVEGKILPIPTLK